MENKTLYLANEVKLFNFTEEDNKAVIKGRATRFNNTNLNHERVDAKSFDVFFQLWKSGDLKPVMNYEHCYDKVIGGIDTVEAKEDGLYVSAHLNKEIPFVNDWIIPNIKSGDISALSTEGYVLNGYDGIKWIDDDTYYVESFIMTALAITTNPADTQARFSLANAVAEWKLEKKNEKETIEKNIKWWLH